MNEIHQLYDKIFKRILSLSERTVINLINGLFGTNHPINSTITYNWTEHEDKNLKRTIADGILSINNKYYYHLEAQMTVDEAIIFRMFEYGFGHAYKHRYSENGEDHLIFPRPCIIYMDEGRANTIPDEYVLTLHFEGQGSFQYKSPIVKLQNMTIEEFNEKKLIAFLPFHLLKLRKTLQKKRTKETLDELQKLIMDDIIGSIERNEDIGNISHVDAIHLKELTCALYAKLYEDYDELEDLTMRLYDQSLELPSDKYLDMIDERDDKIAELSEQILNMEERIRQLENLLVEKNTQ